jgi:hypothetical protein
MVPAMIASMMNPLPAAMAAEPESGTRLVVTWWTSADGLRFPRGFRDSTLGFDCSMARTSDALTRCVPSRYATIYYADGDCTKEVLLPGADSLLAAAWDSGDYATVTDSSLKVVGVYKLGTEYTQATYVRSGGSCLDAAISDVLRVGSRVPDTDLAELRVE